MSGIKSRSVIVRRAGVNIAGVKTKSISVNGSEIDITSDDNAGVRQLMDDAGTVDMSIKVSGVVLNEQLRAEAVSSTSRVKQTEFVYSGFEGSPGQTFGFSGPMYLSSYSENGDLNGAMMFDAEFKSAGTITYTPK